MVNKLEKISIEGEGMIGEEIPTRILFLDPTIYEKFLKQIPQELEKKGYESGQIVRYKLTIEPLD